MIEVDAVRAEQKIVMQGEHDRQRRGGSGADHARAQRLRPLVEVDDRVARVKAREQIADVARRRAVPDPTGGRSQRIALGPDIRLAEVVELMFGCRSAGPTGSVAQTK